jgi:hypothetical protein
MNFHGGNDRPRQGQLESLLAQDVLLDRVGDVGRFHQDGRDGRSFQNDKIRLPRLGELDVVNAAKLLQRQSAQMQAFIDRMGLLQVQQDRIEVLRGSRRDASTI